MSDVNTGTCAHGCAVHTTPTRLVERVTSVQLTGFVTGQLTSAVVVAVATLWTGGGPLRLLVFVPSVLAAAFAAPRITRRLARRTVARWFVQDEARRVHVPQSNVTWPV